MKSIIPPPKPPRLDPMDRNWTQEEEAQAQFDEMAGESNDGSKSMSLDQTDVKSSNVLMLLASLEVPLPTAERTIDMDIVDEEEENSIAMDATLRESESPESLNLLADSSALSAEPLFQTPLFGPELSTASYSPQQQQLDIDNVDDGSNRRLSDIADLQSSMDELTQIDIAATQLHYDAEEYESGYVEDSECKYFFRLRTGFCLLMPRLLLYQWYRHIAYLPSPYNTWKMIHPDNPFHLPLEENFVGFLHHLPTPSLRIQSPLSHLRQYLLDYGKMWLRVLHNRRLCE